MRSNKNLSLLYYLYRLIQLTKDIRMRFLQNVIALVFLLQVNKYFKHRRRGKLDSVMSLHAVYRRKNVLYGVLQLQYKRILTYFIN